MEKLYEEFGEVKITPISFEKMIDSLGDEPSLDIRILKQLDNMLKLNHEGQSLDSFKASDIMLYEKDDRVLGFTVEGYVIDLDEELLERNAQLYQEEGEDIKRLKSNDDISFDF